MEEIAKKLSECLVRLRCGSDVTGFLTRIGFPQQNHVEVLMACSEYLKSQPMRLYYVKTEEELTNFLKRLVNLSPVLDANSLDELTEVLRAIYSNMYKQGRERGLPESQLKVIKLESEWLNIVELLADRKGKNLEVLSKLIDQYTELRVYNENLLAEIRSEKQLLSLLEEGLERAGSARAERAETLFRLNEYLQRLVPGTDFMDYCCRELNLPDELVDKVVTSCEGALKDYPHEFDQCNSCSELVDLALASVLDKSSYEKQIWDVFGIICSDCLPEINFDFMSEVTTRFGELDPMLMDCLDEAMEGLQIFFIRTGETPSVREAMEKFLGLCAEKCPGITPTRVEDTTIYQRQVQDYYRFFSSKRSKGETQKQSYGIKLTAGRIKNDTLFSEWFYSALGSIEEIVFEMKSLLGAEDSEVYEVVRRYKVENGLKPPGNQLYINDTKARYKGEAICKVMVRCGLDLEQLDWETLVYRPVFESAAVYAEQMLRLLRDPPKKCCLKNFDVSDPVVKWLFSDREDPDRLPDEPVKLRDTPNDSHYTALKSVLSKLVSLRKYQVLGGVINE